MKLELNGRTTELDVDPEMPLLWAIRDVAGLTGTKYGCGIGICGACTVHLDGRAVRACLTPVSQAAGRKVDTIETLGAGKEHALQAAWRRHNVPQCGYCQPGQLMQAAALLEKNPHPSRAEIVDAMQGNICRCGTYQRIIAAIEEVAGGEGSHAGQQA